MRKRDFTVIDGNQCKWLNDRHDTRFSDIRGKGQTKRPNCGCSATCIVIRFEDISTLTSITKGCMEHCGVIIQH